VAAAGVAPGKTVVEIGPGTGLLTEALLEAGAEVLAVEVDQDLAALLTETLAAPGRLTVCVADALAFDFCKRFAAHPARGTIQVVGNIPYNISTPLILRLIEAREVFQTLYLTLQREVGARLMAVPGTKAYGGLTLACQYRAVVQPVLPIPRTAFYPAPEVASTLVRFDLLDAPRVPAPSPPRLFRVIRAAFGQRRKTLRNALRHAGWPEVTLDAALEATGIIGERRGETLSLTEFAQLAEALPERARTPDSQSDTDFR
jgi:16S rRNA (adenine1518-N6/adenine1519-N6)-dimethyltransferase